MRLHCGTICPFDLPRLSELECLLSLSLRLLFKYNYTLTMGSWKALNIVPFKGFTLSWIGFSRRDSLHSMGFKGSVELDFGKLVAAFAVCQNWNACHDFYNHAMGLIGVWIRNKLNDEQYILQLCQSKGIRGNSYALSDVGEVSLTATSVPPQPPGTKLAGEHFKWILLFCTWTKMRKFGWT